MVGGSPPLQLLITGRGGEGFPVDQVTAADSASFTAVVAKATMFAKPLPTRQLVTLVAAVAALAAVANSARHFR